MPVGFDLDELIAQLNPNPEIRKDFVTDGIPMPEAPKPEMALPKPPRQMPAKVTLDETQVIPSLEPKGKNASEDQEIVNRYVKQKFNLGDYSDENRKKLEEDLGKGDFGNKVAASLAALGTGLMGGNAAQAAMSMMNASAAEKQAKLDQFDKGRAGKIQEYTLDRQASKNALEDADLEMAMDPGSSVSKSLQGLAKKIDPSKDYSQMSAYELQKVYPQLQKVYEIDQRRLEQLDNRRFQERLAGMKEQEREDLRAEKKAEKDLMLNVPGFERTGEVLPKPEEAMKLRKATASAEQLQGKLNRLKDLVKKYGSFEYGGEGGQEMESLATEIQLLSKSPEMYELGVLTGPDMSLLQKITADPANMSSFFTRDNTRLKQIDSQLKSVQDKLSSSAKSMGYQPRGAAPQEQTKVINGKTFRKVPGGWESVD